MTAATLKDTRFWDNIADSYSRKPVADEEAYEIKLSITREYLTPNAKVFEFGCGTGSTALRHAPFVGHVDATDLSPEMIAIARQKADEAGVSNVNFYTADIASMEPQEETYDVILGLSILHLVKDKDAVMRKVHRMLKPGGVFVTSTACLGDHQGYLRPVLSLMRWIGKAPFVATFTQEDLIDAHNRAGFQIVHQWHPKKDAALFLIARKMDD